MASEMVDTVLNAEKNAAKAAYDASEQAQLIEKEALDKAKIIISEKKSQAKVKALETINKAKAEAEKIYADSEKAVSGDCEKIKAGAKSKQSDAVKEVLEAIIP